MAVALTLETLGDLDQGFAAKVINKALAMMAEDLDDRGEDGQPRKVIITVTTQKVPGHTAYSANLECQVKLPNLKTDGTLSRLVRDPVAQQTFLEFSPSNPANPDQMTFEDLGHGNESTRD